MNKIKIIGKIATYFAVVSLIFTIVSAISTYLQIQISGSTVPADYLVLYILSIILPYLFLTVLSAVVVVVVRGIDQEVPSQTQSNEPTP